MRSRRCAGDGLRASWGTCARVRWLICLSKTFVGEPLEVRMGDNVADFLLKRLQSWGVKRLYGYPGDGINGIMGALGRNRDMEFIQARHEELAAFMACAHAKFTGEIGVCLATSGPGAIHLLNGLYDARADHQ